MSTRSPPLPTSGAAFLLWELSTPFVYVRWVLLKLGRADSRLLLLNNMLGFLVFVCCRNIYGPCECGMRCLGAGAYLAAAGGSLSAAASCTRL